MKKIIFLMGVVMIYLISCTGSRVTLSSQTAYDTYKNQRTAADYTKYSTLMPEDSAIAMISNFRHHKFKGLRGVRLNNAWASFDPDLLKQLTNDNNVKQICFRFAAQLKGEHDTSRLPAFLLQAIMKGTFVTMNGKGSTDTEPYSASNSLYFRAIGLCPPPKAGCKVPF